MDADLLVRMRDTMTHRGPDGEGLWVSPDRTAGLGHRRLAIVDLSPEAAQPMSRGNLWLSFNGEIYNQDDLRRQLGPHRFRTGSSDSEVILHAYEEWGLGALSRLRGMFALALYDVRTRRLLLARDRLGLKPLYYTRAGSSFLFASEIKALLEHPGVRRAMNLRALGNYLTFMSVPPPETMFEGICKLAPGHYLELGRDSERTGAYWRLWDHVVDRSRLGEPEVAERLLTELRTSVRLHQRSDRPVGVLLSGGIDSSANAFLFAETARVKTFSIGFANQPRFDELSHARSVAEEVGAEHHEIRLERRDLESCLPRILELHDEPLGDPVSVPLYCLSRFARQNGVVVVHVGEGADELFCGYPSWRTRLQLDRINRWPVPAGLKRLLWICLQGVGAGESRPCEALRRALEHQPLFWGGVDLLTERQKERLFSPDMRQLYRAQTSWDEPLAGLWRDFSGRAPEPSPLNWMSFVDLCVRLPELLLMRVDRMTMGSSVEARVPFLDHVLVELAMGIGQAHKTRGGRLKHILKQALRPVLPRAILERPKQGLAVPLQAWLQPERVARSLERFCRTTGVFEPAAAARLALGAPRRAWALYNLARWHERWIG